MSCINCNVIESLPGFYSKMCGCYICLDCFNLCSKKQTTIKCKCVKILSFKVFKKCRKVTTLRNLLPLYPSFFYDNNCNKSSEKEYNDYLEFKTNLMCMREKGMYKYFNFIIII